MAENVNRHRVAGPALWKWWQDARQQAGVLQAERQAGSREMPGEMVPTVDLPMELDWLLQEVAGVDRLSLRLGTLCHQAVVDALPTLTELNQVWQRRLSEQIPVQYLLGQAPWRDVVLSVSPAVLIPRPETEILVDLAASAVQSSPYPHYPPQDAWADLGTGSGAIAIGLARTLPAVIVHAVDWSAAALAVARQNIQQLDLEARIHCYQGSWLEPLGFLRGQLGGIVANPPYIPTAMIAELQPEVAEHEPHLALDGGIDGLDCIRTIIATAPRYLQPGGVLLLEMMAGQAAAVRELLHQQGCYGPIQIHPDLAGIERFALAYRHPSL